MLTQDDSSTMCNRAQLFLNSNANCNLSCNYLYTIYNNYILERWLKVQERFIKLVKGQFEVVERQLKVWNGGDPARSGWI